jgi:acyl carrier protein
MPVGRACEARRARFACRRNVLSRGCRRDMVFRPMSQPENSMEEQLKELIVDTLALEDVAPSSIDTDAPLFGEGLGLDSIDALEIALAIHSKFGVKTEANDPNNRQHYYSIKTLAEFVRQGRSASSSSDKPTQA